MWSGRFESVQVGSVKVGSVQVGSSRFRSVRAMWFRSVPQAKQVYAIIISKLNLKLLKSFDKIHIKFTLF